MLLEFLGKVIGVLAHILPEELRLWLEYVLWMLLSLL
jgi:hypothetical protein